MKIAKLLTILFFTFFSMNSFSQEKLEARAAEMTQKLNDKLGDYNLSSSQEDKINVLYLEKLKEIIKLKKEGLTEEELKTKTKELHKSYAKKIQEILDKNQKMALKEYNSNN